MEGADKNAEKQLRAYIGPNNMELTVYPFENGGFAYIAHVEMRNFGQTPAYDLTVWSDLTFDIDAAVPFDFTKEPKSLPSAGIIFPQSSFHINKGTPIAAEIKEAIFRQQKHLFLWGTIRYTDAFKKRRYFRFRLVSLELTVGTGGVYKMGPHGLGYDAD